MKIIYQNPQGEISLSTLENAANAQEGEKLSKDTISHMMNRLILDFGGEMNIKDNAEVTYKFTQLKEELAEAERLRAQRESGKNLGNIVFDSHD